MVNNDIRNALPDGVSLFDNPSFDNSIIRVSNTDCIIYDYEKMINEYMKDYDSSEEDAIDFIDNDTAKMISYIPYQRPIILYKYIYIELTVT